MTVFGPLYSRTMLTDGRLLAGCSGIWQRLCSPHGQSASLAAIRFGVPLHPLHKVPRYLYMLCAVLWSAVVLILLYSWLLVSTHNDKDEPERQAYVTVNVCDQLSKLRTRRYNDYAMPCKEQWPRTVAKTIAANKLLEQWLIRWRQPTQQPSSRKQVVERSAVKRMEYE